MGVLQTFTKPLDEMKASINVSIQQSIDRNKKVLIDQQTDGQMNKGKDSNIKVGQSDIHGVTKIPAKYHMPAFEAGEALGALEKLKDKPFSITCSFHHPHPPYLATEEYIKMYPPEKMVPPVSIDDDMADSPYRNMKKNTRKD